MEKNKFYKKYMGEVRREMEKYLSDINLEKDAFLREKITSNPSGYISISLFTNRNKVKKLGITLN